MLDRFNEGELKLFNVSYFPEVENDIGSGMSKQDKVLALLGYCQRREVIQNLLGALEQERPSLYQKTFPQQLKFTHVEYVPKPRNPKQLFISYSSKDVKLAQQIAKDLQARGFDIFITPNSIRPGEEWVPAISRGLDESGVFLILLTPNALNSKWVRKEVNTAIALDNSGEARLLFLDVADRNPPSLWRQWQFLPFGNKVSKQNLPTLLALLHGDSLPAAAPQPEKQSATKMMELYLQSMPAWLKWGIGLVLALLIVIGAGNAIFGGGSDGDEPEATEVAVLVDPTATTRPTVELTATTKATVDPTATTKPTVEPTATTDANSPPQIAALGDSWQRPVDEMTLVYVPSGTFLMGSDDGQSDEQPPHEVTLDDFWIDQTEVTNKQYALCVADSACEKSGRSDDNDFNGAQQPVVSVDWFNAKAYCEWAGSRLPSEAQWEYAARGVEDNTYPWGNELATCDLLNYNRCVGGTTAVSSYSPEGDSWVGASDMAGNVREWVADWYDSAYYDESVSENPLGPTTGSRKVLRGGSWSINAYVTRASDRDFLTPTARDFSIGFRCVAPGI